MPQRRHCWVSQGLDPTYETASICIFLIDPVDRTGPRAVIFPQQLLGSGLAALHDLLERRKVARLVGAVGVEVLSLREPRASERQGFAGKRAHIAAADRRREGKAWHRVAQRLPLLGGPRLDDVPGSVEAGLIIEEADPERRDRRQAPPWAAVRSAHLQITL